MSIFSKRRLIGMPLILHFAVAVVAACVLVSAFTSCHRYDGEAERVLTEAGAVMEEHPDSALCMLEGLDGERIKGKRLRAMYGLLLTQARDKNYIDDQPDSLIRVAVAYFDNHHRGVNAHYRMLSHYYLGRLMFYKNDYVTSSYESALALRMTYDAGIKEEAFWRGRTLLNLGLVGIETTNPDMAIRYGKRSAEIFDSLNMSGWKNDAMILLGRVYRTWGMWSDVEKALAEMGLDTLCVDQLLDYYDIEIDYLVNRGKWQEAYEKTMQYKKDYGNIAWAVDHEGRLSMIYARLGKRKLAEASMAKARLMPIRRRDSLNMAYYAFHTYVALTGDSVLQSLQNTYDTIGYAQARIRSNSHPALGFSDYYRHQGEIERLKKDLSVSRLLGVIGLLCGCIGGGVYLFAKFRRNKMQDIERLNIRINSLLEDISELNIRGVKVLNEKKDVLDNITESVLLQLGQLNRLSRKKYTMEKQIDAELSIAEGKSGGKESLKRQKLFLEEISAIISSLGTPELFKTLEETLNIKEGGIIKSFKEDFPEMTAEEIKMITLIFSKVGNQTIMLMLDFPSQSALTTRKSRLKKQIEASDSKNKEVYLKKFSNKE